MQYKFSIDKNTCFVYWSQVIINWNPYFYKPASDFFVNLSAPWKPEEEIALQNLSKILKSKGDSWLWDRYAGKPISIFSGRKSWEEIRMILKSKFDLVWQKEFSKLEQWKTALENYNLSKIKEAFSKSSFFLGCEMPPLVEVKLSLAMEGDLPVGSSMAQRFPNMVMLNISRVSLNEIDRAIGVLVHETLHLAVKKSKHINNLFEKSNKNIIAPHKINIFNWKWKNLFNESLIGALASMRLNNYFGRILTEENPKKAEQDKRDIENSFPKIKNRFGAITRKISSLVEKEVATYLNNDKKLDQKLADDLAHCWLDYLTINR